MSAVPQERDPDRLRPAEIVAGFLASAAMVAGALALAYEPFKLATFGILLALVAAAMAGRNARLAAFALAFTTACWVVGMVIAIATQNPLW